MSKTTMQTLMPTAAPASGAPITLAPASAGSGLLSRPYKPLSLAEVLEVERGLNAVYETLSRLFAIEGGSHAA